MYKFYSSDGLKLILRVCTSTPAKLIYTCEEIYHHLLTVMSFQTCVALLLLRTQKEDNSIFKML